MFKQEDRYVITYRELGEELESTWTLHLSFVHSLDKILALFGLGKCKQVPI